ncbi:MAG: endolytic transglycosylase MltG [Gammaproteobacteria bacterium]|nr:endolytic transglycosylase MltG [Gammaproteobacteria bacterium]
MNRFIAGFLGLGLLLVIAGYLAYQNYLTQPLGAEAEGYALVIERGSALRQVANQLEADQILRWPALFALHARLEGVAGHIQAGEYVLSSEDTADSLLTMLVTGQVKLYSLTVIEGWTVAELLTAIRAHPAIKQTLQGRATSGERVGEWLAEALELGYPHAEGLFFPDTYRFPKGMTDVEFLLRANAVMLEQLRLAWEDRSPETELKTPYEALILASIVERESALHTERPEIAGVFVRRLQKGMRLQTDPTVIYGLGEQFDGNLTRRHLRTDNPYNTYTRKGLPPTPIALPGASSLKAALNPADGDTLFFVATGNADGSHYFSKTLEAHNAAVARYLKTLKNRSGQEASP